MERHIGKYVVYYVSCITLALLWVLVWSPLNNDIHLANKIPPSFTLDPVVDIASDTKTLCTPDTFNVGNWVHQPLQLSSKTPDALDEVTGYQCKPTPSHCYRRDDPFEFERSQAILDYTWKPNDCHLVSFDAKAYAAHLAKHPMLFVGDSITQLAFESLQCMLGDNLVDTPWDTNMTGGTADMWTRQLVHPSKLKTPASVSLGFIRSDFLVNLDNSNLLEPKQDFGHLADHGVNFPWIHVVPRFEYIVINTGAYWTVEPKWKKLSDRKKVLGAYKTAFRKVTTFLKGNINFEQRVWIRSTPYGHAKCSQWKEPLKKSVAPTPKKDEHQWDMFHEFEKIWADWVIKENDPRFNFLDVSPLTNLRGDAHSDPDEDCLHTCLPGPVDEWNRLLFHEIAKHSARV